jgi:hypothetical protein
VFRLASGPTSLRLTLLLTRRSQAADVYDEQIIARSRTRVQPQEFLWFPAVGGEWSTISKKRAAVSGGF